MKGLIKMARGAYGPSGICREQDGDDGLAGSMLGGRPISIPDEESVIGFDALYESMCKCRKGVMWKGSVAGFCLNGAENIAKLSWELKNGSYKPRPVHRFTIYAPKQRDIVGIAFRDRVYQRSLNDNLVYPIMSRSWIYDNMACQLGKGTDRARNRFECFMQRSFRKHDIGGGVLSLDIKGYYPLMWHWVAEKTFAEGGLPDWGYKRVIDILRTQYSGDRGYNPGSQIMQIAGVSVLNGLDHYIKERLRVKHYIRYMDDLRLIHHDTGYLAFCENRLRSKLSDLGFAINEQKTCIRYLTDNVPFLGFTYRLTSTGKVVKTPITDTTRRAQRKITRLVSLERQGMRPEGTADLSYESLRSHIMHADSYWRLERLDEWYSNLWNDGRNDAVAS